MVLNLGPQAKTIYDYLDDSKRDFTEVTLHCQTSPVRWQTQTDGILTWEFTIPIDASTERFSSRIEGLSPDSKIRTTEIHTLRKN